MTTPVKALILIFLVGLPGLLAADPVASVRISNRSFKMSRGECDCGLGLVFYLHFSSIYTEDPAEANGELAPQSQGPYSHWSYLVLEDVSMTASAAPMQLDVPFRDDLDNDGIPDFFNPNQEVGSTTGGAYESVWGSGTITAVWSRASGSTSGSCTITLRDPMLGILGPFYNGFEIIQSGGSLSYKPGAQTVTGSLKLGASDWPLDGAVAFQKSITNRFNLLTLKAGTWTNAFGASSSYEDCLVVRVSSQPTLYKAVVSSPGSYGSWALAIQDPNDTNGNGIPDFSDDVFRQRPEISLHSSAAGLEFKIKGEAGQMLELEGATSPLQTQWSTVQLIPLTNSTHKITLTKPSAGPVFWRLKVH